MPEPIISPIRSVSEELAAYHIRLETCSLRDQVINDETDLAIAGLVDRRAADSKVFHPVSRIGVVNCRTGSP